MILTCPACNTRYVVKDGSIPEGGRKVRCASCKHSWHQDGDPAPVDAVPPQMLDLDPPVEPVAVDAVGAPEPGISDAPGLSEAIAEPAPISGGPAPSVSAPSEIEGAVDFSAEHDAAVEAAASESGVASEDGADEQPWVQPTTDLSDDDFRPYAGDDEDEPPRSRWPLRVLTLVVVIAALAAALWFLAPTDLRQRVGIAGPQETPLLLQVRTSDRQTLASGNELFAVSGRVINPTDRTQTVPPLRAELRNSAGKLIYGWTIAPPARTLPAGASASFNSAEVNVPKGADQLTVSLGAPAT